MTHQALLKPHDLAADEINGWRGRCLDLFARGERTIDLALETALTGAPGLAMKHLAGHRLADLAKLVSEEKTATEKQKQSLQSSLDSWLASNTKRAFLAHGVTTVLLDRHGDWHAQFDFVRYQGKQRQAERWSCSKHEAWDYERLLERSLILLSSQLGHFRKRICA